MSLIIQHSRIGVHASNRVCLGVSSAGKTSVQRSLLLGSGGGGQQQQVGSLVSFHTTPRRADAPPKTPAAAAAVEETRDPHQLADDRIRVNNSSERLQAAEALNLVSNKVRIQNLATATLLFGFAAGVMLYSMNAVGRGDSSEANAAMKELEEAAEDARRIRSERAMEEAKMKGLLDGSDEDDDDDDLEDEMVGGGNKKRRPLWRRVVFFWRSG